MTPFGFRFVPYKPRLNSAVLSATGLVIPQAFTSPPHNKMLEWTRVLTCVVVNIGYTGNKKGNDSYKHLHKPCINKSNK